MRKRKWLKRLFSVVTVLLMVFALAPSKVDASSNTIYANADNGINISIDSSDNPNIPQTIIFDVVVDGELVAEDYQVSNLAKAGAQLTILAEGYDVTFSTTNSLSVASDINNNYNIGFWGTDSTSRCTINLATSKTSDNIQIGEYGTFSWSKQHAGTSAYARIINIYVNGTFACEKEINTPRDLSNTGVQNQYWFTPSDSYNKAYTMSPSEGLDTATRKNLRIDLTTKCGCGRDTCLCEGGCNCPEDCECDECMGTNLEDNQINTGYGILEYSDPGFLGGYNLTVKINVNGQNVYTSDQLRISGNTANNLVFNPANGYFLQNGDHCDIDAYTFGATWTEGTLSFAGALEADREYDNVLTINLVSFENRVQLDVERKTDGLVQGPSVMDNVTGYRVSYTIDGTEYTYDYDQFDILETPNIPTNVPVTITAICKSPYEVAQWSTENAHAGNVTITGSRGQGGNVNTTEAYGNSVTLTVNSSTDSVITLYIDEMSEVKIPSENDFTDENGSLKDVAVNVDCVNTSVEHGAESFGLIKGTFEIGELEGNSADGYTVDVTVNDLTPYLEAYNESISGHSLAEGETSKTITLHWNNVTNDKNNKGTWEEDVESRPTINVICETTTDEPDGPTVSEIEGLLDDGAVTIDCVNDEAGHKDKTYTPIADSYTIGKVVKNEDTGVYTSAITFNNEKYVDSYNTDVALGHTLNDGEEASKAINFVWNADGQKWEVESNGSPVTFKVICENGGGEEPGTEDPDKPTLEEIDELLPDTLVSVDCITDENHADQTYNLIESAITIGDVEGDADKRYTSTVTFAAKGYVDQYSTDMKKDHTLADGQPTEHKLVFVWDAANQKWQLSIGTVTPLVFQVECDTTTEPGTDEPGTEDPENPDDEKPGDDQQGTENPDDQKPGDQDGQGTGDKTDGSQDGDKNGGADSGKQDSTKGDGTKTSASLGVSLFGSLASVSATGAAILSVLRRKRR